MMGISGVAKEIPKIRPRTGPRAGGKGREKGRTRHPRGPLLGQREDVVRSHLRKGKRGGKRGPRNRHSGGRLISCSGRCKKKE